MTLAALPLPLLAAAALTAFAANSLLARAALADGATDAASFTALRILSGAAALAALLAVRRVWPERGDLDWRAPLCLFGYAAFFSFGYVSIDAGLGALILFGAVQATMIGAGLVLGERTSWLGAAGVALAALGVVILLAPGAAAPDPSGVALMLVSGVCWGAYSLIGRGAAEPVRATAVNFLAAAPLAVLTGLAAGWFLEPPRLTAEGAALAAASGVLASAAGYVVWYAALARLTAMRAAILQLGVPLLTAIAGVLLLAEPVSWRLAAGAGAILGGVGLYLTQRRPAPGPGRRS